MTSPAMMSPATGGTKETLPQAAAQFLKIDLTKIMPPFRTSQYPLRNEVDIINMFYIRV